MDIELSKERKEIIEAEGNILVTGGPGSGKTTLALLKAQKFIERLESEQEILFLSFSNAAIRQILIRCKDTIQSSQRKLINVRTYHAFCMEILKSHGRLLHGKQVQFLTPRDEGLKKFNYTGDWEYEKKRLADEESTYCFDFFATGVSKLLNSQYRLADLIGDKFPMIIFDEFQDTDDDQWSIIKALDGNTNLIFLADPDQSIFDYRENVSPIRVDTLKKEIVLSAYNLKNDNFRSPNSDILQFADSVYNNTHIQKTNDVNICYYDQKYFDIKVYASIYLKLEELKKRGIENPSIGVFCTTNRLISQISAILTKGIICQNTEYPAILHDVLWDAQLSIISAEIIGSILEWHSVDKNDCIAKTLRFISNYYKIKNSNKHTKNSAENARKFDKIANQIGMTTKIRSKVFNKLCAAYTKGLGLMGEPISDWLSARRVLENINDINEINENARFVRLFKVTDILAEALKENWDEHGKYFDVSRIIKGILTQDNLTETEQYHGGCSLMNIHKSKGKEFDGVVLIEARYHSRFFDVRSDNTTNQKVYSIKRKLLRVAITRAKSSVTILRPLGAPTLISL